MKTVLFIAIVLVMIGCQNAPTADEPQSDPPISTTLVASPTPLPPSTDTPEPATPPAPATATHTPLSVPRPPSSTKSTVTPAPEEETAASAISSAGYALRFYGTGSGDIDRVKVSLVDASGGSPAVDVGATDFTLEWWMKANLDENQSDACVLGNDNWITGNIIFDRDIWGNGDYGDYGIALAGGQIAFGVNNGEWGEGICSISRVADGQWHHIAVARKPDGWMAIMVNGKLEAQTNGPPGDISYRDGRVSEFPNEPYLVLGAEKHDAGAEYPSYSGWLDEVRLSTILRYAESFSVPTAPFEADDHTAALWHFDEGTGEIIVDSALAEQNIGMVKTGGANQGPQWDKADIGWAR